MPKRSANANLSALLALLVAVPLALGVVIAWAPLRDSFPAPEPEPQVPLPPRQKGKAPPKTKAKEPAPKEQPKAPQQPETMLPVLPPDDRDDLAPPPREFVPHEQRNARALAGCRRIAQAIDAFVASDRNPGKTPAEKFPAGERDLFAPPFGGPSFLPNGQTDLTDPWGHPYQFEFFDRADGTKAALVYTFAPDGTVINQHGIGEDGVP